MKKAVIRVGGTQHVVTEGQVIEVNRLKDVGKSVDFVPLMVVDGDKTTIGTPEVKGAKVTAEVTDALIQADKVTSIRYKSKKRVHKVRGHRQQQTRLTIKKIA